MENEQRWDEKYRSRKLLDRNIGTSHHIEIDLNCKSKNIVKQLLNREIHGTQMRIVGVTDVRYVGNWRQLMQFKDPTLIQKKIAKVVVKEPPGRYCSSAYFNDVLLCTDSSNVDYFVQ